MDEPKQPQINKNWKFVTRDASVLKRPEAETLVDEALRYAPPEYVSGSDQSVMLPRYPLHDRCRLCGKTAMLTKEHIPPKQSGNKSRHRSLSLDDWLKRESNDATAKGILRQGGTFGYTLCRSCNSKTGRWYGDAYKQWAIMGREALSEMPLGQLDKQAAPLGIEVTFGDGETQFKPGAVVRQVLSCLCSLSGPWDIAERHPEIRRIVLGKSLERLPDRIALGVALYAGPQTRFIGPQLRVDVNKKSWEWISEIAFPPFAFLLVIASNEQKPGRGLLMNDWPIQKPEQAMGIKGLFEVGFGWSPHPGDYRTKALFDKESK